MNRSSKRWKKLWDAALFSLVMASVLLTGVVLLRGQENAKEACLTTISVILTLAALGLGKKSWIVTAFCFAAGLLLFAAIIWHAFYAPVDEAEPDPPGPETEETAAPGETAPAGAEEAPRGPVLGGLIIPREAAPAADGVDLLTFDVVEDDLTAAGDSYFPVLEIQDYRHLFLSFTEECTEGNGAGTAGYQTYILDNCGEWDVERLRQFIWRQFQDAYRTVEDYPVEAANGSGVIAERILRLDELEEEIHQARAANEYVLPLYDDFAVLYLEIIDIAPRGEYYIQLARPYEEGVLRMARGTPEEKNAVLQRGANAIASFRTALTYQDPVGDSVPDIFYRIAKIYHFIGDTPGLLRDIRAYFYRVAAAYLTLASELETELDTYYGYSTYYCAMVYHKLGIITASPKVKLEYLDRAEALYRKADESYQLDGTAKREIGHALSDIDTRQRQMG